MVSCSGCSSKSPFYVSRCAASNIHQHLSIFSPRSWSTLFVWIIVACIEIGKRSRTNSAFRSQSRWDTLKTRRRLVFKLITSSGISAYQLYPFSPNWRVGIELASSVFPSNVMTELRFGWQLMDVRCERTETVFAENDHDSKIFWPI